MANLKNSRTVSIEDGKLTFLTSGDYTIDFSGNTVKVKLAQGQNTNLTDSSFAGITSADVANVRSINLVGINFAQANQAADGRFEPDTNVNALLKALLDAHGVAGTLERLTVNGGTADAIKLIWDYLDDGYSYYNTPINQAFVELGAAYVEYLRAGGEPFLNVVAKYTPDGADAGTAPDRLQSMHDNLLGNLNSAAIIDRFFDGVSTNGEPTGSSPNPDEETGLELLALVEELGLDDRPYYSGNEGAVNNAYPWDVDNGLISSDWLL